MAKKTKQKLEEPYVFVNFEKIFIDKLDSNVSVLNFLRNQQDLVGTKEGCSEGDCGACSILIYEKDIKYSPINSCILKVGQIIGKNILVIELDASLSIGVLTGSGRKMMVKGFMRWTVMKD